MFLENNNLEVSHNTLTTQHLQLDTKHLILKTVISYCTIFSHQFS